VTDNLDDLSRPELAAEVKRLRQIVAALENDRDGMMLVDAGPREDGSFGITIEPPVWFNDMVNHVGRMMLDVSGAPNMFMLDYVLPPGEDGDDRVVSLVFQIVGRLTPAQRIGALLSSNARLERSLRAALACVRDARRNGWVAPYELAVRLGDAEQTERELG
jgi:hypothetical protein